MSKTKAPSLPLSMSTEVQGAKGEMLGRMDRASIREAIYARRFKGQEMTRLGSGAWVPLVDQPEFRDLLELLGVDIGEVKLAKQQVKGWKRDSSAKKKGRKAQGLIEAPAEKPPFPLRAAILGVLALGMLALLLARSLA